MDPSFAGHLASLPLSTVEVELTQPPRNYLDVREPTPQNGYSTDVTATYVCFSVSPPELIRVAFLG
jgi:hypothetical protein